MKSRRSCSISSSTVDPAPSSSAGESTVHLEMNSTADSETSSIDPVSYSSTEDRTETGSTEDRTETSSTEDRTETGSSEDHTETGTTEDHDRATTETSSTEDSPPLTETRSSALPILSVDHSPPLTETRSSALPILSIDLSDLSTCPPPSSLSDDQKYQILTIVPAPLLSSIRLTVKNDVFNHTGFNNFPGFVTLFP